jgi:hypothetical protein
VFACVCVASSVKIWNLETSPGRWGKTHTIYVDVLHLLKHAHTSVCECFVRSPPVKPEVSDSAHVDVFVQD